MFSKSISHELMHKQCFTKKLTHSASVPSNMRSLIPEKRNKLIKEEEDLAGFCIIKAHPLAKKAMQVHLKASNDKLKIRISQIHHNSIEYFELCNLDLQSLVVGWIWGDSTVFVIAVESKGELYNSIYCYPTDKLRHAWLLFFRSKGVRTAPFSAFQDKEKTIYISSVKE